MLTHARLICAAARQQGGGSGGGKRQQRGFGEAGGARRGAGGAGDSIGSRGGRGASRGGGRGGGRGSGGSGRGKPQKQPRPDQKRATIKAPPRPEVKVSEPLRHSILDVLSGWEPAPAPFWGTFCGHLEGDWLGQYAAYTPWGADPEPVWADAGGRYLLHAYSRTREVRDPGHARGDLLLRTTRRGAYLSDLLTPGAGGDGEAGQGGARAAQGGGPEGGAGAAAEDDDAEGFPHNAGGAVVFDGGSYSVGPPDLGCGVWDEEGGEDAEGAGAWELLDGLPGGQEEAEDGGAAADGLGSVGDAAPEDPALAGLPASTVVVEQALVRGGQERRRLVATLKCRRPPGGEIDLEVARLVLYTEHWSCLPPSEGGAAEAPLKQPPPSQGFGVAATSLPRASPEQLGGAWNAFGVAATSVEEQDPETGEMRDVWVYSSREERQEWSVPGLGAGSDDGGASDGGSLWLPGGCVATFRMAQQGGPAHDDGDDDDGRSDSIGSSGDAKAYLNGNGSRGADSRAPTPRGVVMSFVWLGGDGGACLTLEREYDAAGQLVEVRHGSAVKGGWSGGRM